MEPRQRLFIAEDPGYQVKSLGLLTDEDLHVFVHSDVLDAILADAAAHVDKLRAGALVGGCYTDGRRRFIEIEGTVLLIEAKPAARPFALDESHHDALAAGIAAQHPGAVEVGLYFTHPRLGLYLSRSETATLKAQFDAAWSVTLVTDPVADKFTFFQFRGPAPVKSGFHIVTRTGPKPMHSQMGAEPRAARAAPPRAGAPPVEPDVPTRPEPQLTREELFRLATEEVFKDGKVDEEENRTLQLLGGLLRMTAESAIKLAKQARKKFRSGELAGGSFDPEVLYQRAHQLAHADGELATDEANILAALRLLLKLPVATPATGPAVLSNSGSDLVLPSPRYVSVPAGATLPPFRALLTEFAGVAFDRQVYALDRLGDHDFSWDIDAGTITLAGGAYLMQALGTTAEDVQSWVWAWAERERPLPEHVLNDARRVLAFGKSRNVPELITPALPLATNDPNELAMVASGLTGAHLYYRIPFEGGALYVLITDPTFGRSPSSPISRIPLVFPRLLDSIQVPARPALVSYMRASGLDVTEEPTRVTGRLGADALIATFDAAGNLVQLAAAPGSR